MPIYEYRCSDCGTKFDLRRSMGQADEPAECPHCHGTAITRLLSMFAAFGHSEGGTKALGGSSSCATCGASTCTACPSLKH